MVKKKLRNAVRKIIRARDGETIADELDRKYKHIIRLIPHKQYSLDQLIYDLKRMGVRAGDVLIVHSSWNGMYALQSSPQKVINALLNLIGREGTLIMPCYSLPDSFVDLDCFISKAGIMSEILHKKEGAIVSEFPKFTMVAYGKEANEIVGMHSKSNYQFDEYSPYYIAMNKYDAKILMLGLGRNPHKITVFHCASYDNRDTVPFYKDCYTKECKCDVKKNGTIHTYDYIDRANVYANDKRIFRKLFAQTKKVMKCFPGYSMIVYKAKDAYNTAYKFCSEGGEIYKVR